MAYKLLLADDSITIQKVVELVLAEEDFQIKSVSNGEEAMKVIDEFQPDIVLADIEMPKMNGYQLCEKIKRNPGTKNVPVILLAGAFEPIDNELARNVGADDSVIKPFESQELISKINAVLTMGGVSSVEEEAVAEEGIAIAEEEFEVAEAVEAVEAEAEPVAEVAAEEEDLWTMDEVNVVGEAAAGVEEVVAQTEEASAMDDELFAEAEEPVFEAAAEEADEEVFAVEEAEMEIAPAAPEPAPVVQPKPQATVPAAQPVAVAVALSSDEMMKAFRESVDQQVAKALAGIDLKASITVALMPIIKDSLEKVLWEIAPELTDKMLKETLKGSIASLGSQVEKVIWETVPDLASAMISKEIEKIKSEF